MRDDSKRHPGRGRSLASRGPEHTVHAVMPGIPTEGYSVSTGTLRAALAGDFVSSTVSTPLS